MGSERERLLKLWNGLTPLTVPQVDHSDAFVAHGAVGGDLDDLLIFRKRLRIVTLHKIGVAEGIVIQPIIGVGSDRFLISGDRFFALTSEIVSFAQVAV